MPVWIIVVYALAVARLTGMFTVDEVTRPVREWLVGRFDPYRRWQRWLAYLLGGADDTPDGCPWCVSIWVGMFTAPLVVMWWRQPVVLVPMLGLAVSQTTGMITGVGRE